MFSKSIVSTATRNVYPGLTWCGDLPDDALVAMLAAFLGAREDEPSFSVRYCEAPEIEDVNPEYGESLIFVPCLAREDVPRAAERFTGWTHLPMLERFFHQRADVRFLQSPDGRFAVVFPYTIAVYHMILSVLPRIMRGFDAKSLSATELALCECCLHKNADEFETALREALSHPRIRRAVLASRLRNLNRTVKRKRAKAVKDQIRGYEHNIDELSLQIATIERDLRNAHDTLFGIENAPDNESALREILTLVEGRDNVCIPEDGFTETGFQAVFRSPLVNFPVFEAAIRNRNSDVYRIGGPVSAEDRTRVLRALFCDEKYTVMLFGSFYVSIAEGAVLANRGSDFVPEAWKQDAMPNPHLHYFACLGGNNQALRDAMRSGDYLQALTICGSSVASVNLHETPSCSHFLIDLFNDYWESPVLRRPDGTKCSPKEAAEELKREEENA